MIRSHQNDAPCRTPSRPISTGDAPTGTATSKREPATSPLKPGGATPTIVNGAPLNVSVRPSTSLAPANCVCQNR